MDPIQLAAVLAAAIVVASVLSVEAGIAVALFELALGVVVGNVFELHSQEWLDFIASFASIVLTFLAGAEVDPDDFRERLGSSLAIGVVSFVGPFVVGSLAAWAILGWSAKASLITGTVLSDTSIAIVYAVLMETRLSAERVGKLLMSACFVTGLGTALALSAIFIRPNAWFLVYLVGSLALIVLLPRLARPFFRRYGDRVIEPEIKLVFASLLALMVVADASKGPAILPAFVLGLAMSRHYAAHRQEQERLRVVAFAFLTPFFFLKSGLSVSAGAVVSSLGVVALLAAAKLGPRLVLVFPLARRADRPHAPFLTLLMSTGLTLGTIAALYGLGAGILDRTRFSALVAVIVLTAIVPTVIAQWFFEPIRALDARDEGLPAEEYV